MKKQVLILTMSDKYNEYCVAGFEVGSNGKWIRLIGNYEHFPITNAEAKYDNGELCQALDVVEVDVEKVDQDFLDRARENNWTGLSAFRDYPQHLLAVQPENYFVKEKFKLIRKVSLKELVFNYPVSESEYIYLNGNDSLTHAEAVSNNSSLVFVKIENLRLYPKQYYDSKKENWKYNNHYKSSFTYNGNSYDNITVTDPDYNPAREAYSEMEIGDAFLVVSLGVLFNDNHYKLIAKIFEESDLNSVNESYPYEKDMNFTQSIQYMMNLKDVPSEHANDLKKKIRAWLIENCYLKLEGNRTAIGDNGPAYGVYEREAVSNKGENYIGIFYGKEIQELMYSKLSELVSQMEETNTERSFQIQNGYVRCEFNDSQIKFKRTFAGHILEDDEIYRLIAGDIITITDPDDRRFRGRLQQRRDDYDRPYYGFTPDFDPEFRED